MPDREERPLGRPMRIVLGSATLAGTVGFGWSLFTGWDGMPTAVFVPFFAGCLVVWAVMIRDLVVRRRHNRRRPFG
jgi:hypothetical protein